MMRANRKTDEGAWLSASDAATLVGLNPYDSLISLYARKKGLESREKTCAMRVGLALEELTENLWRERTGKGTRLKNAPAIHPALPYCRAWIDRKVIGEKAGLEIKVMGPWSPLDITGDQPPALFLCQCQWQMWVCGLERMYLAVLRLKNYQLYDFVVHRDEPMIGALAQAGQDFWQDYFLPGQPPPPDGSAASQKTVALLGMKTSPRKKKAEAPPQENPPLTLPEQAASLKDFEALGREIETLKRRRDKLAQQVQLALGDREEGVAGQYKISYQPRQRETLDAQALKKALPQVYRQFARVSNSPVFKVSRLEGEEDGHGLD